MDYNLIADLSQKLIDKVQNTEFEDEKLSRYSYSKIIDSPWISPKIQMYSYLLWLALREKDPQKCAVIDYGGGLGLLSALAKLSGVKTVIYIDIDNYTCKDAQLIGSKLGFAADYYLCGDIQTLSEFASSRNFDNLILLSYDVLEHIYDIESYMKKLNSLSKKSLRIVMGSGANPFNPYMAHEITRRQKRLEYKGRIGEAVVRNNDYSGSYFDARLNIITAYAPNIAAESATLLASKTRGLRKREILLAVDSYVNSNRIPCLVSHPTNTCDPYSGNWEEQLMNPYHLTKLLECQGFQTKVLSGQYFNDNTTVDKKILTRFLNTVIKSLKSNGIALPISPFYILFGEKESVKN